MRLNINCGLVAVAAILMPVGAWANSYTIVDLGESEIPVAVNAKEMVAGNATQPRARAEIFRGGKWHGLSPKSDARGINSKGDVVGEGEYQHQSNVALVWQPNEDPLQVQTPKPADGIVARGINDHRLIVGGYDIGSSVRCFKWAPGSKAIDLGVMNGGDSCSAYAVNNAGQITGMASTSESWHAFFWQNGTFTDIGLLGNGEYQESRGLAINASGNVVGIVNGEGDNPHAFIWNGSIKDLDPTQEYYATEALSINDSGMIVGFAQRLNGPQIAVRFAGSDVIDLSTEVTNLGSWILQTATSVNAAGIIVGEGVLAEAGHAYMLVPQ